MEYNIGDMFVDIRDTKGTRSFIVTDVQYDEDEKETYYFFYISPDGKEDVFSSKMLKMFVNKHIYIHYPVVK
jgi:predicted ester cyclase